MERFEATSEIDHLLVGPAESRYFSGMRDRFRELREATEAAVLRGSASTPSALREAVARGEPPEELRPLVEKIRRAPYTVSDADLSSLASRYGEDELFELVIAAAVGAAGERLDAGLRVLEEA